MKELLRSKQARWALKALPHISIVISGMLIVFFCIDRVNSHVGFMTNEFHKIITFTLAVISLGYSVFIMSYQRRMEREQEQRRIRAMQARRQAQAKRPAQPPKPAQGRPVRAARPPQAR